MHMQLKPRNISTISSPNPTRYTRSELLSRRSAATMPPVQIVVRMEDLKIIKIAKINIFHQKQAIAFLAAQQVKHEWDLYQCSVARYAASIAVDIGRHSNENPPALLTRARHTTTAKPPPERHQTANAQIQQPVPTSYRQS